MILCALLLHSVHLGRSFSSQGITIYEDAYGVPSISAANDAEAIYALGYVEGKDHAVGMATNYKMARGRLGEVNGKGALLQDGFLRSVGFEKGSIELASHLTGETKVILDAFTAGANKALAEQKDDLPRWIEPFSAVDVLSLAQFVNAAFPLLDLASHLNPGSGSNQFAVAPTRTATHHPILSIDPHLGWDGQDGGIVWQEFAIYTPDIHFRGVTIPGLPTGVIGHNDKVAWSMTNNNPQLYTIYTVKLNPQNRSQYSYHGQWKEFKTEKQELRYLDKGELKSSVNTVRSTEWGPMVPFSSRSVRLAIADPIDTLRQSILMMQAKSATEFREAFKLRGISMWNFVYADTAGNIGYQYNALVSTRDAKVAWDKNVPGDLPETAWGPLWSLDDLPHIENPFSGLLVNCNSDPNLTPLNGTPIGSWPSYVTSYGKTTRWELLSDFLKASSRLTIDRAKEIATDTTVPYAKQAIAELVKAVPVGNAIEVLKKWDGTSRVDSVGCVLYTYWLRDRKENRALSATAGHGGTWSADEKAAAGVSLESAAKKMIEEQGSLDTRWGGVQYMQRGSVKIPVQGFGYIAPGSSLAAISPASAGTDTLKDGRSHADFGSSFRMIVSLDPKGIQSWSVLPYGNSDLPKSPHYADQMELYAVGKYKPTNFGLDHARKAATKTFTLTYQP